MNLHSKVSYNMTKVSHSLYQESLVQQSLGEYSASTDLISEGLQYFRGLED